MDGRFDGVVFPGDACVVIFAAVRQSQSRALVPAADLFKVAGDVRRYRPTTKAEELAQRHHVRMADDLPFAPSWNVALGQDVLTARFNPENGERSLDALHWGLIPPGPRTAKSTIRGLLQ
jgi:hypothetical protein